MSQPTTGAYTALINVSGNNTLTLNTAMFFWDCSLFFVSLENLLIKSY